MYMPKPFGLTLYSNVSKRIAKKIIKSYGRDMWRRFKEFERFKLGYLVCTCDGLNSRVLSLAPYYQLTRYGKVLVDIEFSKEMGRQPY